MVAKADEPPQQDLVWSAPWQMMDNFPEALTETPTYPDLEPPTAVPPKTCVQQPGEILYLPPYAWHASATIDESMIIGAHHHTVADMALQPKWIRANQLDMQEIEIEDNKVTIKGKANSDPNLDLLRRLRKMAPHHANANINVARKLYNTDGGNNPNQGENDMGKESTMRGLDSMIEILNDYFMRVQTAFQKGRLEQEQYEMFVEKQLTNPLVMEYFAKSKMDPDTYPTALPMRQKIAEYLKGVWREHVWKVRPQEEFDPRVGELFDRWEHGLDQIRASHILIKHNESFSANSPHDPEGDIIAARSPEMGKEIAEAIIKDNKLTLLNDKTEPTLSATFEELVNTKSDDAGTAGNDPPGDNGWFGAGQVVHEFYVAAKRTPPGKVYAEPIESKFGYHIICERFFLSPDHPAPALSADVAACLQTARDRRELTREGAPACAAVTWCRMDFAPQTMPAMRHSTLSANASSTILYALSRAASASSELSAKW